MELSWEESLSQSRRLPLLQVVSNNKSFSVGIQSPAEINAPRGCAEEKHADVLVFEYLETKGKISGRKKQELHLWRKKDIQKRCEHQAHRRGMRIFRICAWNTSRLAYDGSGTVVRDPGNHSLCTFQNGKRCNSDLSASYNIGARYFIRELVKSSINTGRYTADYLCCGNLPYPAWKKAHDCAYSKLHVYLPIFSLVT